MSQDAAPVRNRFSVLAVCGLLLLAVIAVFGQTARYGFVNFNDDAYVYENWQVKARWPSSGPAIFVGRESGLGLVVPPLALQLIPAVAGADGYRVQAIGERVLVVGNDARGTLFGVGALLRHLKMDRDVVEAPDDLRLATAPKYSLRGHQLGYRPKTNSYDGWSVPGLGTIHARPGGVWRQRHRADSAALGRRSRQPPVSAAAHAHDGRNVPPGRCLRARRVDLVSGDGQRLFGREDRRSPRSRNGARSSANCRASTRFLFRAAIPATPGRKTSWACLNGRRKSCAGITPKRKCGFRRRASPAGGWMSS